MTTNSQEQCTKTKIEKNNLADYSLTTKVFMEYLGSIFLVLAAISPIILFNEILGADIAIAVIADALAVAFVLFALIEVKGIISSHFNPLVSIIMAIRKEISPVEMVCFIIAQLLGGFTGTVVTHLMYFQHNPQILTISTVVRNNGAFIAEIFGTFLLILVILLLQHGNSTKGSITIGLMVGGMLMATSSTMFANPQVTVARMFTYAAAGVRPIDGLIFIGMQVIGATLATLVYTFLVEKQKRKKETSNQK